MGGSFYNQRLISYTLNEDRKNFVRIIFLGTPEFAVPTLEKLIADKSKTIFAVVCQPDRPSGRGNKIHQPPTKVVALSHNIPVLQPISLAKSPEMVEQLKEMQPDVIVMVAFGQILKKAVLEMPKQGVINIHASLLPHYRGPAPINWAIINGDKKTGVTTMYTEAGVDTGPMLLKAEVPVGPDMTSEELSKELSILGADLLMETLNKLEAGNLISQRQDDAQASHAPMLTKELGKIEWSKDAEQIHNLVRGLVPWPGTYALFKDTVTKITQTKLPNNKTGDAIAPGTIIKSGDRVEISCGETGTERIELIEVQPANKSRMSARDWANGLRLTGTEKFQ